MFLSTVLLHVGQVINFWQGLTTAEEEVVSSAAHPYTANDLENEGKQWLGSCTTLQRRPRSCSVVPRCHLLINCSWLVSCHNNKPQPHGEKKTRASEKQYTVTLVSSCPRGFLGQQALTPWCPCERCAHPQQAHKQILMRALLSCGSPVYIHDFSQISWHLEFPKAPNPRMIKLNEILSFPIF